MSQTKIHCRCKQLSMWSWISTEKSMRTMICSFLPSSSLWKNTNDVFCLVMSNRTFDIMLNPRASFYVNQRGSGFAVSISFRNGQMISVLFSRSILRTMLSMLSSFRIRIAGSYSILNNGMDMDISGNKNSIKFSIPIVDCRIMPHKFVFSQMNSLFQERCSSGLDLVFSIFSFYSD